jgi:hypothetical protein
MRSTTFNVGLPSTTSASSPLASWFFFSTETGDAWLLDTLDHLAARLARDGDPEPIDIEDTETTFAIGWKGQYRIEGRTFVYVDGHSGRVTVISGYPTQKLAQLG